MQKSVFDYIDYKNYLHDKISTSPAKGRGLKLQMAQALGVQTAYISQVLNKDPNFNLEQAMKLNHFWHHSKDESRYFCLLITYARAGSHELREFIKEQLNDIHEKRKSLKNRLDIKSSLNEANQHIYYSSWTFAAIHILTSIPSFQTVDKIVERLRLSRERVQDNLQFLIETGLVVEQNGRYIIGTTRIHLDADSLHVRSHHYNWRSQSVISVDRGFKEDLHYSNVVSLAKEDVPKVKEILIKAIEECRAIIRESPEEDIQVITVDSFKL